jgi:hypothetical protein
MSEHAPPPPQVSGGHYRACSHAVANGDGPRLSVVYELQPSTGTTASDHQ